MSSDDIGNRGQWACLMLFTELCGRREPYFRPHFLGDKFQALDLIVEVVDEPSYFFFVQVKATSKGYTGRGKKLKTKLSQKAVDRMVACPAPTYLVGIDHEDWRKGFLLSMNEARGGVSSLPTKHRIDCTLLGDLNDEVITFWRSRSKPFISRFVA